MESGKNTYSRIVDQVESVTRVDFCIYGNVEIENDSVIPDSIGINKPDIYNNGEPVEGGVIDTRLGVTESHSICGTCGEKALTCPGHFGHIKLVEPVFHMGFSSYVKTILSCICIRCSKLLVYKNEGEIDKLIKNKQGKQRYAEIRSASKGITHCQKENSGCGTPAHKITIDKKHGNVFLLAEAIKKSGDTNETVEVKKRAPQILTPQLCYDLLKNISREDCIVMGFDPDKSRPEDMIIVNFAIPPVQVRPSIKMEISSFSTQDDDLTHKIVDIIKTNENLRDAKGDGALVKTNTVNDDFMLLQFHVATFYANDIIGLPKSLQKNKKATKSLSERLKGKEGRVRGNLMGKRVNMSARTVITSDPNIPLNGIGIPLIIAKNLTYPEIVTVDNIKRMEQLVKNGRNIYPGANFVIKNIIDNSGNESMHTFDLKYNKKVVIQPGNIVERHLNDGDIVLFNRQPSLHKLSMMGHMTHIIPNMALQTFRMNVNVTEPYNADFDGDEMNIHVPQSMQTVAELRLIANAAKRFVSPARSDMAIVAKQDTLMGSYVLSKDATVVDWRDAMNIMMNTSIGINHGIPKNKKLSGKFLYSQILPHGINIHKKNGDNFEIRIHNGVMKDGLWGKPQIAQIVQKSWFQYGSHVTQNFIDDLQKMILQFLMIEGFTVSIKDTIVRPEVKEKVYAIVETSRKKTLADITKYENDPYVMSGEAFETNVRSELQAIQSEIQKSIMNDLDSLSGISDTILSGSNGTEMNAGQIMGCIGQVIVEDKRIQKRCNNRTLPNFHQHDDSAFARGFCHGSYITGLNPMEFFFQVMGGREGIINTAIKTADTGYIQRKIVKLMEDIKVEYDGTVRNANNKIIQCVYGDNGVNTEKQIKQKIDLILANNQTVRQRYIHNKEEINKMKKSGTVSDKYTAELNEKLYTKLIHMRDAMRKIQKAINVISAEFTDSYFMPVDIHQLLINITNRERRNNENMVDPYYVLAKIKSMYSGPANRIMKYNQKRSIIKKEDEQRIKLLLKTYLYDILAPKKCINEYKLSKEEFDEIYNYFIKTSLLAKVEGGEMVGFVGAQSIGEPVTQTNLKSFHKSGTGKTVSGGLVRVKELLSVTKNIKTPVTEIVLQEKYKTDKIAVNKIASYLKYTTLKDVVDIAEICYDPNPKNKNSIMSRDGVANVFEGNKGKSGCQSDINVLPWTLRLVLSKEKMIKRNITMLEIKTSFCHNWGVRYEDSKGHTKEFKKVIDKISQAAIVTNFDNSEIPMVHIRFDANNYNFNTMIQFMNMIIEKFKIKGIAGINESNYIDEKTYNDFDEKGDVIKKKQYIIVTEGINLGDMAQINGIDLLETRCNDIVVIYETFGVEAARTAFIREFTKAIESTGGYSNYQHLELLADCVTHMGGLIAVNRHGANKLDTDPFSRASFEKTVEQLLAAAVFCESDHIRSVSARIMVGQLINGGTGAFDLFLDHNKIKRTLPKSEQAKKTSIVKAKTAISDLIRKKKNVAAQ